MRDATVLDVPAVEKPGPSTKMFVVKCVNETVSRHEIYNSCKAHEERICRIESAHEENICRIESG